MKTIYSIFIHLLLISSCANIVAPSGGEKDTNPPQVLKKTILIKQGITEINFTFNEYIQLNNWEDYFYISPPITKRIQKKIKGKILTLTISDTLTTKTTYNISLNNCLKDNNEGNILDTLQFIFSTSEKKDAFILRGKLQDAYTLIEVKNAWVMLFDENRDDGVIFNGQPNYIAKTNENGYFYFPNLKNTNYTIVCLTEFDFIYNENEKIAFLNTLVNPKIDSFISLLAFNPIIVADSITKDITIIEIDSLAIDSLAIEKIKYGSLTVISLENKPCIFQLCQDTKVINEFTFTEKPYVLNNITPGKYQIKYISDSNRDGEWTTGSWKKRTQAEQVNIYPSEITIRSNWDLELEWELN